MNRIILGENKRKEDIRKGHYKDTACFFITETQLFTIGIQFITLKD